MKKFAISIGNFYDDVPKLFIVDEESDYEALNKAMLLYMESDINNLDKDRNIQLQKEIQASDEYPKSYEELKELLNRQNAYFIELKEIDISHDILGTKIDLLQLILKDKDFYMSAEWLIKIIFPDKEVSEIKDIIKCLDELHDIHKLYQSMENFDKE